MNEERLRERLLVFLEDYVGDEAAYQLVLRRLRPSVEADRLIETFLRRFA
jgi:hypothetical protein